MTRPGSIGSIVPPGDDDVYRQLAELKRQIAELRTAKVGNAMTVDGAPGITVKNHGGILIKDGGGLSINDGGDIAINDGGTLSIYDASGRLAVLAGFAAVSGHTGFATQRPDGSASFQADDSAGGFVGIFDRAGNIVVSDDATSGAGLASPHLALGELMDTNVATWPATSAGAFTTIAQCVIERQNPKLAWTIAIAAYGAGVTGQFKLLLNGTQIGSTQSVTNTVAYWSDTDTWPGGTSIFADYSLELQARVSAGAGTAAAQQYRLRGVQT